MFKKNLLILVLIIQTSSVVFANDKISQDEIWNSKEGLEKLERSNFKNDFYQLVNFYQPQENPLFCSIASTTIIRNALEYGKISSQKTGELKNPKQKLLEYRIYSQQDFFNSKTEEIKKRDIIEYRQISDKTNDYDPGMNLDDLTKILIEVDNLKAKATHVNIINNNSLKDFRNSLKEILKDNTSFVIANFDGKIVGKKTRGHFSPLVAYDEKSDSVLVMDVALHKNQWYWVDIEKLFSAMNTKDGEHYRGYITISR